MFVLATARNDFFSDWQALLEKRGEVARALSLNELHGILLSRAPKLVLLDMELAGSPEPANLRSLHLACNNAKLLLGGITFKPASELAGLAMGASACLDASLPLSECEKIVDVVLQGGIWLSSAGIPALVSKLQNLAASQHADHKTLSPHPSPNGPSGDFRKLTRREWEVAQLVSNGANNKTIAKQLLITDRTVKAHLTSIFEKLNVPDRLQLALRISAHEAAQR